MADDVDQPLLALFRTPVELHQAAHREVNRLLVLLVDQSIGSLLNVIVLEAISRICLIRQFRIATRTLRVANEFIVLFQRNDHVLLQRS